MGHQALSERKVRRIRGATGLSVVWASARGGTHVLSITTADHQHGWYEPATGEWGLYPEDETIHGTSCRKFDDRCPHEVCPGVVVDEMFNDRLPCGCLCHRGAR